MFRDLGKSIGCHGDQKRLQEFQQRYHETPEGVPRFLFYSHYSCPGYVIGFHVRKHPQWMLKFQSGRFDHSNRLFSSVADEWQGCMNNRQVFKELIPEFFMESMTDLFVNKHRLDLGVLPNGDKVDDVKLPEWAQGKAETFLKKHR